MNEEQDKEEQNRIFDAEPNGNETTNDKDSIREGLVLAA